MSSSIASISVAPQRFVKKLVYYYMPNCPYCREFEPVFMRLANICKKNPYCSLAAVDITRHRDTGVSIKSVPTVIYFDSVGVPHKMQASSAEERTLERLASFLIEQYEQDVNRNR